MGFVSTLRSALDELRVEDLARLSDDELASGLDEFEHAGRVISAERARRLAEVERRGSFARDGHLSASSWLAERHRISHAEAASSLRLARALQDMPATAEALASGELSRSAVQMLAGAREASPEAFARTERTLVDAAQVMPVASLRTAVAHWRLMASPDEEERLHERRHLHVSPLLDGMVRVDGDLDPEVGQCLITALRAVQDADVRSGPDLRTPAQRRADALGELCRWWLDRSDRSSVGGERQHVVVTMDLDSLERRAGRRCELSDAGPIMPEAARRLACDANVSRVITDARSVAVDLGRRTKVVPAPLRRAVVVRDRRCRFPGCDRPPGWCDCHHARHWADGGETALGNLILLCRPHHRAIHSRGFGVEMVDGQPMFRRPDGSMLEDRAPP